MVVAGKLSGIQRFLFATAETGGAQAKRLRARSFIISLLAETAALRVLRALDWPADDAHYPLRAAGKFLLSGRPGRAVDEALEAESRFIRDWLARHTNAEIQFTLAVGRSTANQRDAYRRAQETLHAAKGRPWAPDPGAAWDPSRLVLGPLDTPCVLCRRDRATEDERDPDTGELRRVCLWCGVTRTLGQRLPSSRWLTLRRDPIGDDLDLLGCGVGVHRDPPGVVEETTLAVMNLQNPRRRPSWCPVGRFLERRLMAHVPTDDHGRPVEFVEIARAARGDHLLGVLVADADSLGVAIDSALTGETDLTALTNLSRSLDAFFAGFLKSKIEHQDGGWRHVYTVFSGGDDLVMAGPWDVMFELAGELRDWFREHLGRHGLTISAGLALIKPKRPIKAAVAEAERLLEAAKTVADPAGATPKDQCAAFGQIWKWDNHQTILAAALRLVGWVDSGQMQRGWLHTLLALVEARHPDVSSGASAAPEPDPLATARLAHHVARNYRRGSEARGWAERLVRSFDDASHPEVRYLPAALRHALTATRAAGEGT